jgi:DNA-binding response OmpR family regulator
MKTKAKKTVHFFPKGLTKVEHQYFLALMQQEGRLVPSSAFEAFHESTWNSNVIAVHMRNLRKKLGDEYVITTVRGFGYSIRRV